MIAWIITGAIAVLFLVMAIFLMNGKGSFLIAGFNTMSAADKSVYNKRALCKAVGRLLLVLTILMVLWPLSFELGAQWLFWVSFILFMAASLGFAVYANTGNRFKIYVDPNPPARMPMSRLKKVFIVIVIVFSVQFTIGIGLMIYTGERDPIVDIHNNNIRIRALYGMEINIDHVLEITLIDKSMQEIGIGQRTNGYDSGGQALKGHFSSPTYGSQRLFVYYSSSPTIKITYTHGVPVFISFRSSETTVSIYQMLSSATS